MAHQEMGKGKEKPARTFRVERKFSGKRTISDVVKNLIRAHIAGLAEEG